jgi:hypothetical protein
MTPLTCSNCEATYRKSEARSINIFGPDTARYVCPKCHRGTEAAPPQQPIGEVVPGIDHIEHSHEDRETLATCWFTNDARLRFRETEEGWIREEVLFPDGGLHESRAIGRIDPDDGQTACHCLVKKLAKYETATIPALQRNWPHIAAVVLDP